jgi:hypothetical protein
MAVAFVSASNKVSGTATTVVNAPASISSGNVLICIIDGNASATFTASSSGWTLVSSQAVNGVAGCYGIYYKIATGSEPSTYSWTVTGGGYYQFHILQFSGNASSSPIDGTPSFTAYSTATTSYVCPSVTVSTTGEMLVCFAAARYVTSGIPPTFSTPSGMSVAETNAATTTFQTNLVSWYVAAPSSGGTGTNTSTLSSALGGHAVSLLILPGSVGYTVTFNNNGGTGSLTAETDSTATALSLFSTGTMALAAFHFVGWNTVADGTGTAYADGATYAFSASATLYAQWAPDAGIVPILM